MKKQDKLLSVIVPVYNVEQYLKDCLDSLLDQNISSDSYEIICVDDGSTDSSAHILQQYAEEHDEITIITKLNGGVSSARNAGIKSANGKYIAFVDSDDMVISSSLGLCIQLMENASAETLSFRWISIAEDEKFIQARSNKVRLKYRENIECNYISSSNVWSMIYNRSLIKGPGQAKL